MNTNELLFHYTQQQTAPLEDSGFQSANQQTTSLCGFSNKRASEQTNEKERLRVTFSSARRASSLFDSPENYTNRVKGVKQRVKRNHHKATKSIKGFLLGILANRHLAVESTPGSKLAFHAYFSAVPFNHRLYNS